MAEPPRILVLFCSVVLHGAERGNLEALAALRAQGAEILCLVSEEGNTGVPPVLDRLGFTWRKVPYLHLNSGDLRWYNIHNPSRLFRANLAFLRAVREFKPTHIHAYNPTAIATFMPALILNKTPLIYRAGDEPTVHNAFWRICWRFIVGRTARFVANSRFIFEALQDHGVAPLAVRVIYNVPPDRSRALASTPPALSLADGPTAIYVGQLTEMKGPHLLIDAFASLADDFPSANLIIVGRISDWAGDAWAKALQQRVLADPMLCQRIHFTNYLDDPRPMLRRSQVHVAPSLFRDPFPNAVIEAKAAGVPSIIFPNGGLPELIRHGEDGWICGTPTKECIAEALRFYFSRPQETAEQGRVAKKSLMRLEIDKFDQRWLEVYREATDTRREETSSSRDAVYKKPSKI
jgi:glycosyltransferase involved in cell wall biosynthesis